MEHLVVLVLVFRVASGRCVGVRASFPVRCNRQKKEHCILQSVPVHRLQLVYFHRLEMSLCIIINQLMELVLHLMELVLHHLPLVCHHPAGIGAGTLSRIVGV